MIIKSFIPELDLWIHNILYNNNLTSSYVHIPVKPSDKWICKDSVIELLFNETFDPSGNVYDDNLPFIYKYKTANIKKLQDFDSVLSRRVQIYPYKYVWCASDSNNELFKEIQNLVIPTFSSKNSDNYYSGINPTKYVTKYKSVIVTSTNDELHQELPDEEDPDPQPEPEVYGPNVNVFGLTKEELEMCQYLYYYRTGQFELICCFPHDFYYTLKSPLSKWIYLYLQCYLFNIVNYEYLNTITTEDDGVLRCMFEKHAQDRIYQYIQKQNFTVWNEVTSIGDNELRRKFEDYTMICHTFVWRKRIFNSDIKCGEIPIFLEEENQPVDNVDFEFIYDGKILTINVDYTVVNKGNEKDTRTYIVLKNPTKFKVDSKYQLMWSALIPTTPMTRDFYFANAYGSKGDRTVINMYCNDCGDGCSRYGQECGKNRPRPVLIEEMIDLHNKDKFAHPELVKEIDKITALIMDHIYQINNPHNVTKAQVGLGNVDNTSDADKPLSNIAKQEIEGIKTRLTKAEKDIKELDQELDDRIGKKVDKIFNEEQFIINGDDDNF